VPSSRSILFGSLLFAALAASQLQAADVRTLEQQMAGLLNADRAAAGLPPLKFDARLADVARAHSTDMARSGYFSHTSPTTGDPQSRLNRAGIAWGAYAENIAFNSSVAAAQKSLMRSTGHRTNILNPQYDTLGIGIVPAGRQLMVTQVFLRGRGGIAAGRGGSSRQRGGGRRIRFPFGF
jgi:uncharacterized protein YkwD